MPSSPRPARHAARAAIMTMLAVVLALLGTAGTALAHNTDAPATPGNIDQGDHSVFMSDGCSTPGAAINSEPGVFDFLHACIHHDGCYHGYNRAGEKATIDRRTCDGTFLADMQASCQEEHGSDTTSPAAKRCYNTANLYYLGVRLFGRPSYRGTGNPI